MTTDVVVTYAPRGAARQLLECREGEVLIAGPAGTGKSLAMLQKMHLAALLAPGMRGLLVRDTLISLTGTTLVTFEKTVLPEALRSGLVSWFGGSAREPAAYRYSNGSTILVGGLDKPGKFLSSEFDRVAVDEATEIDIEAFETLVSRLRGTAPTYKQIICACNPAQPGHWLKTRADSPKMRLLHSRHVDNPAYYGPDGQMTEAGRAYLVDKLGSLTGVRRLRLLDGIWASAEGIIYDAWDPRVHVVPRFDIPAHWPRYWSVDFGFTNPFVLQCWAEDHDGRLYLYREIYKTRTLVEDHARHILKLVTDKDGRWTEPEPLAVICDHDAEGRATLEEHLGLSAEAAHKSVLEGIEAVQARIRPAGDGRPRLFVFEDALVERDPALIEARRPLCTRDEVLEYVWADSAKKEAPMKENDHGMDALRYATAYKDLVGRPRLRWI